MSNVTGSLLVLAFAASAGLAACGNDTPASATYSFGGSPLQIRLMVQEEPARVAAIGGAIVDVSTAGPFTRRMPDGRLVHNELSSMGTEDAPAVCSVSMDPGHWTCLAAPADLSRMLSLRLRDNVTPLTPDRCRTLGEALEVKDRYLSRERHTLTFSAVGDDGLECHYALSGV